MTGLLFTCALPLSCNRCCLLQYCLHSPGLFLCDWPTSPENVSQGDGVWGYNHATRTRQSATLHAATLPVSAAGHRSPRKRPQDCVCLWQERKKKRCCSEEIYTFPCHSAFPPFPLSCLRKASSQNTCSRILTCLSSACFADRSETDSLF